MDKITFQFITDIDRSEIEFAIIDKGNGEFITMPKSDYDRQQAEQSTPNLAD
jgi:hypothetical protein